MKTALVPLALLWLAAHAFLLGLILSLKFISAKMLLVLAMAAAAVWFAVKRRPVLKGRLDLSPIRSHHGIARAKGG